MGTRNARRCVQDAWKGVRGARRKLNRDSGLDVPASYSENPIKHSQREDRHARQHLGMTLTTIHAWHPRKEHPRARQHLGLTLTTIHAWHPRKEHSVRDNTWG